MAAVELHSTFLLKIYFGCFFTALGADDPTHFPGKPWEHYIVKDKAHGFKCLKCKLVGYVSDIREKDCTLLPPGKHEAPPTTEPTTISTGSDGLVASAALVGEKQAKAGVIANPPTLVPTVTVSTLTTTRDFERDLEREIAALVALEAELEYQAMLEEEEQAELAELDSQIKELETYMTEEEQLERALQESLQEAKEREAEETVAKLTKKRPLSMGEVGCLEPPAKKTCAAPDPKKEPKGTDQIPELDPKARKIYKDYWARFVATPQNNGRSSTASEGMSPSLPLCPTASGVCSQPAFLSQNFLELKTWQNPISIQIKTPNNIYGICTYMHWMFMWYMMTVRDCMGMF